MKILMGKRSVSDERWEKKLHSIGGENFDVTNATIGLAGEALTS